MNRLLSSLLAVTLLLAGCGEPPAKRQSLKRDGEMRVISLAPNTAEILYALGLSNHVVGVSRFTTYPPEAMQKSSVGGTYDPNWEQIIALQPDLIVGLDSQKEIAAQLKQLDIPFLGVAHEHIDEVLQSILAIGKACGAEDEAQHLFQTLNKQLAENSRNRKTGMRVLVCVGHDNTLSRMYVAAKNTYFDELISLAGGINASTETVQKYPEISPEGLAALNPDLIIDILPNPGTFSAENWNPRRAVVLTNNYASIPGPRFILLLKDFQNAIRQDDISAD